MCKIDHLSQHFFDDFIQNDLKRKTTPIRDVGNEGEKHYYYNNYPSSNFSYLNRFLDYLACRYQYEKCISKIEEETPL